MTEILEENAKLKEALEYHLKEEARLIDENHKLREALYGKTIIKKEGERFV